MTYWLKEHWDDRYWDMCHVSWPCGVVIRVAIATTFGAAMLRYADETPYDHTEIQAASDRLRFMARA